MAELQQRRQGTRLAVTYESGPKFVAVDDQPFGPPRDLRVTISTGWPMATSSGSTSVSWAVIMRAFFQLDDGPRCKERTPQTRPAGCRWWRRIDLAPPAELNAVLRASAQ